MQSLPTDLIRVIRGFLTPKEAQQSRCICRSFNLQFYNLELENLYSSRRLDTIAKEKDLGGIKFLLKTSKLPESELNLALIEAARNGSIQILDLILDAGADLFTESGRALQTAGYNARLDMVKHLMIKGLTIANAFTTFGGPMPPYNKYGDLETMKFLLNHGADLHAYNDISFYYPIKKGHFEVIKYLVKNFDYKQLLNRALDTAVNHNQNDIAKFLLDAGADAASMVITDELISWNEDRKGSILPLLAEKGAQAPNCLKLDKQRRLNLIKTITSLKAFIHEYSLDIDVSNITAQNLEDTKELVRRQINELKFAKTSIQSISPLANHTVYSPSARLNSVGHCLYISSLLNKNPKLLLGFPNSIKSKTTSIQTLIGKMKKESKLTLPYLIENRVEDNDLIPWATLFNTNISIYNSETHLCNSTSLNYPVSTHIMMERRTAHLILFHSNYPALSKIAGNKIKPKSPGPKGRLESIKTITELTSFLQEWKLKDLAKTLNSDNFQYHKNTALEILFD